MRKCKDHQGKERIATGTCFLIAEDIAVTSAHLLSGQEESVVSVIPRMVSGVERKEIRVKKWRLLPECHEEKSKNGYRGSLNYAVCLLE